MLFTIANKEQYEAAKKDVLGTIASNLEKKFDSAIAVEINTCEDGSVKLRFTTPAEHYLSSESICLNSSLSEGFSKKDE